MNPEVFYLQIGAEQRGPYTVAQIDHQLNSGLIDENATYWRDGMEESRPVTDLVALTRRKPSTRSLARHAKWLILVIPLLVLARIFGPIVVVGWRETAQYEFTPQAAYWRARDFVRHQAAPPRAVITFTPFAGSRVELDPEGHQAKVWMRADIAPNTSNSRLTAWQVGLSYDPRARIWSARTIQEEAP